MKTPIIPFRTAAALILSAGATRAFWRLPCASPVLVERLDPLVDPGRVSKHVHTIMGANGFNATVNHELLAEQSTCSTCKPYEDNSLYWAPSLFFHAQNGSFVPVKQTGGALIYYLQRQDERDPEFDEGLLAFPEGFRMFAGSPLVRNNTRTLEQRAVNFVCLGYEGGSDGGDVSTGDDDDSDGAHTWGIPNHDCPGGLRSQIVFPACWDGDNLDSQDHKAHMAYPSGLDNGFCPESHPKRFITIFIEIIWEMTEFKDQWWGDGGKHPFVFANGDPTGYGFHADFINGWNVTALQRAVDDCTDPSGAIEYCQHFTLRPDADMRACRSPRRISADPVAYAGDEKPYPWLPILPGCNPVQPGPGPADPKPEVCPGGFDGSGNMLGPTIPTFTDVRERLGWRWVGCALDGANVPPNGGSGSSSSPDNNITVLRDIFSPSSKAKANAFAGDRTLPGPSFVSRSLTVDKCLAFCAERGFRFAGVEYRDECYCGEDPPADDRMRAEGLTGRCDTYRCGGDIEQYCGGWGELGVYEMCEEDEEDCENAEVPGVWW